MNELKIGDYIKLSKISLPEDALLPTPCFEDYRVGIENYGKSVPIGYTVEGSLINLPKVGSSLYINREVRNGITIPGITTTSEIVEISITKDKLYFKTLNSIYELVKQSQDQEQ